MIPIPTSQVAHRALKKSVKNISYQFCILFTALFILFTAFCFLHSDVGIPPPQLLQHALDDWLSTDTKQSTCGLTLAQIVQGSPHYLGVTNRVHPSTGHIM